MLNDNQYARVSDFEPMEAELKATRQYLHANPELSLEEVETARYVAEKLEAWGFEVTRNVGGHGVVARLKNGSGSKSIGIRADMDALPIMEETGLAYASKTPGKMHACGHDGHTTVLLGAAEYLARTRRFDGTVTLIFQPAEENGKPSGAQKMIEDGLFERFPIDAIFGLHNHPGAPEGSNEVVECRHLSLTWASQLQATGKPDYAAFGSKDAIRNSVRPEAEALYINLLTRSPDVRLVPLDQWGGFMAEQLKSLEAAGVPAARQWLVNSGNLTLIRGNVDGDNGIEFEIAVEDGSVAASVYTRADFLGLV